MILALKALVLLLQYSFQRLGNGFCHDPDSCGHHTSSCTFGRIVLSYFKICISRLDSSAVHGCVELLDKDLALEFHVVSWKYPRPQPKLLSSVVTEDSLSVVVARPQSNPDAIHLSNSCWLHILYILSSNLVPKASCLVASQSL